MKKGSVKQSSSFLGFGSATSASGAAVATSSMPGGHSLSGDTEKMFRSLKKKDSTTKVKALQCLVETARAQKENPEVLLREWMAAFVLVSLDTDWRVRLEVWRTWQSVVEYVGKGPALQKSFKQCLCSWLTGMFDSTTEVAAAAKASLPFGADKYKAALGLFKDDLLREIRGQLSQTPESLAEGRSFVSEQDALSIWENLVSASLLLAKHLAEELGENAPEYQQLLTSKLLVKLLKSASAMVRRTCLAVVIFLSKKNGWATPEDAQPLLTVAVESMASGETKGLEVVAALLASQPALWERVAPGKAVWPPLLTWLGAGSARAGDVAFVLPLLAAAPSAACFGRPLPSFVDALGAAFWKAAKANKVRSLAAEVLGHYLDCLHLLFQRHQEAHAVTMLAAAVAVALCSNPSSAGESLCCTRTQLLGPQFVSFYGKCSELFWAALGADAALAAALKASPETVCEGFLDLVGVVKNVPTAGLDLVLRALVANRGGDTGRQLYEMCRADEGGENQQQKQQDLWEAVWGDEKASALYVLALSVRDGALQHWPQLLQRCQSSEAFLVALLRAARGQPVVRKAMTGLELDSLLTSSEDAAIEALRDEFVMVEAASVLEELAKKESWSRAAALLVPKLSGAARARAVVTALYGGTLTGIEKSGLSGVELAAAVRERLLRWEEDVQKTAQVLGQVVQLPGTVLSQCWPFTSNVSWSEGPGLASLEGSLGSADDGSRCGSELAGVPPQDELERAAVVLEVLHRTPSIHEVLPLWRALLAGIGAGLGRSEMLEDLTGFRPRLNAHLTAAFLKVWQDDSFKERYAAELRTLCRESPLLTAKVLLRQWHLGDDTSVAVANGVTGDEATTELLLCAGREKARSWADVDRLIGLAIVVGETGRYDKRLLGLLAHRSWPVQMAAARVVASQLKEESVNDLLEVAAHEELDPWSRLIVWWALLQHVARLSSVKHKGVVAQRVAGATFARFGEDVFGFLLAVEGSDDGKAMVVDVSELQENELSLLQPQKERDRAVLAGRLWYRAVLHLRTVARSWLTDVSDRKLANFVRSFSQDRVCRIIGDAELAACSGKILEGLDIRMSGRSLLASVEKDDVAVELRVTLPPLWPLQPVETALNKGNLPEALLRRWLLSMTILLTSSEGSLVHAVREWGKTALTYFDGVESCHICFCVLSEAGQLPKVSCANCSCGFHAECVAKWFSTSHTSKCCMCQLPWRSVHKQ